MADRVVRVNLPPRKVALPHMMVGRPSHNRDFIETEQFMTDESKEDVFDVERVRNLVELMIEHGLTEIDLRQHGNTVRLKREVQPLVPQAIAAPAPIPVGAALAATPAAPADVDSDLLIIKSPMVGTYYSRANPESDAFVSVGQNVTADKTVCIIEAMKVFNEIAAEVSGTIVAILVEDEEPVEFGKPLMKVRPHS